MSVLSGTYKPEKFVPFVWDTFREGLNTLLRENEIAPDEMAQAQNITLKGRGIPTKRWGTALFFTAGSQPSTSLRGLKGFYKSDGTNELLGLTDDGLLVKRNSTGFNVLSGMSWPSGSPAWMSQLNNTVYISTPCIPLVKYSSPTLVGFPTIAIPTVFGASGISNLSNASGTSTKSYRITAVSNVGETIPSTLGGLQLLNQPATLGNPAGGVIRLQWTGISTASGILQGFNIYGRTLGSETFLAGVDAQTTSWLDDGSALPQQFSFPPTADSTGGPTAKYNVRFQDRMVYAGIAGEPSKVLISGRVPLHERFDLANGGNFIRIEPDAGDDIVGLATYRDRIIIFKQRSIWQITLSSEQIGNFFVTTPVLSMITASQGCIAPRSIAYVKDDIYYLSRRGVFSVGYQLGFSFDLLRTNEQSFKIRPYFKNLTTAQLQNAVATYFDFKYIIAFPGLNQTMVFDVERGAWLGPWTLDANIYEVYYDASNNARLLRGDAMTGAVDEYSENYTDDKGVAIQTILRTRQEDFGDWSLFKNIRNIFTMFRNITGTVNVSVRLEQRNGSTTTVKSFNVNPATGNSGWGADLWGAALWGGTLPGGGGVDSTQTIRWNNLNKAARTLQLTFTTANPIDNYELLGVRGDGKPIGSGFRPSTWRT